MDYLFISENTTLNHVFQNLVPLCMLYVVQVSVWVYTHVCMHVMYEGIRGQLWVSFLRHHPPFLFNRVSHWSELTD